MPPTRRNQQASPSIPTGSSDNFNLALLPPQANKFQVKRLARAKRVRVPAFSPFAIVLDNVDLDSLYSRRLDEQAARKDEGADDAEVLPGDALPDAEGDSKSRSANASSHTSTAASSPSSAPPSLSLSSLGKKLSRKDTVPRPISRCRTPQPTPNSPSPLTSSSEPSRSSTASKGSTGIREASQPSSLSAKDNSRRKKALKRAASRTESRAASSTPRRVIREVLPIPPDSPVKRLRLTKQVDDGDAPLPPPPLTGAVDDVPYTMSFWDDDEEVADKSMQRWLHDYRDAFLDTLLWLDGRGMHLNTIHCTKCGLSPAEFRCTECYACGLVCKTCILDMHTASPFHWVQQWTGTFYRRVALKSLGLRVQLGHPVGEVCSFRLLGPKEFLVIHRNGIHEVSIDFCGCHAHGERSFPLQLLQARLYPATTERPQTCATLDCLDDFHATSLHTKCSAYDYYAALEYLTDGSGRKPPDRYKAFMRMARQYRHLFLLKRRGRGHALSGIKGTAPGELALRCPACPRPGINLPDNWENASPVDRCLYVIYIALDACFQLKRRLMVGAVSRAYLKTITTQKEMSTCSGLAALDYANTKFSRGYAATGVGAGICARHEFVQPNGVGDLQRGERYGNMDYVLASLLRHIHERLRKVLSYDIACQWWKELKERLEKLPPLVRLRLILSLTRFVVPKMHILAHIVICRLLFDLRFVPGSGQTDGEGIERLWASIAGLAASSKLSGHGARADLLDDHWSFWNWCKLITLATLLRRRLDNARVSGWLKMVTDFEADGTKPNPYASGEAEGLTEKEVREQMEAEEKEELAKGAIPIHAVSPSEFVAFGLELEEQQRHIRIQSALKRSKATAERIRIKPLRRKLEKGIARFRGLQATYTPSALVHLDTLKADDEKLPEDAHILLPSAIPESMRNSEGCKTSIVELEQRLRHAQCKVALIDRRLRREQELVEAGVLVEEAVGKEDEMDQEEEVEQSTSGKKAGTGEGRRTISWIWTVAGTTGSDASIQEGLRIEWTKAYARVRRWREEVRVLTEEWRRLPISLAHEQKSWLSRGEGANSGGKSEEHVDGLRAYAAKQAALYGDLIERAEVTRTEERKGRGYRRRGKQATTDVEMVDAEESVSAPELGTDGGDNGVAFLEGDDGSDSDYRSEDDEDDSDEDDSDEEDDERRAYYSDEDLEEEDDVF
ncbi:CxC2 domain-containing protein [Mycena kentingensis (nom. inval.)]|nr:CxC2 domain-containing protein [Mycena kentingensis (nom. inval.)]